jgi:hypothetical protein
MKQFRVIQGGKGHKSEVRGPRLYRAYSVSDLQRDQVVYHDVRFNWYYLEREQPPFPFEDLIYDYSKTEDKQRSFLEREAGRYFTEAEIEDLREYLFEKYGMQLFAESIPLPLKERGAFFEEGSSVIYDFLELSEKEGYPLPFKVWGYYTVNRCISSPSLEDGVRFLTLALELLDIGSDVKRSSIESVVKEIHAREGLLVGSNRQKEERGH